MTTVVRRVAFLDAVQDVSAGNAKVPQSEFLASGTLAIVDQGQKLIAGYTDEDSFAVRAEGPVIVFGDHTRAFKFVDFPFAMGADGVKVLQTRDGFDTKFVYRYLQSREVPSAGYSRHFKFLKEFDVPKPPIEEQRRIAAILDQADAIRAKRRRVLAHLDDLTQSTFTSKFGDPISDDHGLPLRSLEDWVDAGRPITYGILKPGPEIPDGIPYIRVADMKNRGIDVPTVRRTSSEIANSYRRSTLRGGDLLMSIRGHVGRFAFVPEELSGANITQDSARLAISDAHAARYVRAAMEHASTQHWMARRTKGAAVKGINLGDLKRLELPVPPADALSRFAAVTEQLESQRSVVERALAADDELFASLQSRAFRGEL